MKKNFTQLIAKSSKVKKYSIVVTTLSLLMVTTAYLWAAISISITGGGSVAISADLAKNSQDPIGGQFTSLGTIKFTEGTKNNEKGELGGSNTIEIKAPTGWEFFAGEPHGVIATGRQLDTGNPTITATVLNVTSNTITISYSGGSNKQEEIEVSGIQIRAIDGASAPETVTVTASAATSIPGLPATVVTINHTHGVAKKLVFGQQPTSTLTGNSITPAPTVVIQDQFGNTVTSGTSATASVTLAIGNNAAGNGVLGGTKTIQAVNGIATFPGLSIDAAGTGYTLVASSASLGNVTSSSFTISSKTPTLNAPTACITEGADNTVITLTGTNFEKNSVVRVNGNNSSTEFVSSTQLRVTLLASDLATAGNISLDVINPAPPANAVSSTQTLSIKPDFSNASVAGKTTVCTEEQVVYSAPVGFSGYSWLVSEGASVVATSGNTATIRYNAAAPASGKVTVQVSANNTCGVGGTTTFEVAVNQTPPAIISYTGSTTFCQGGEIILSASEASQGQPAYTYEWYNGSTPVGTNASTFTADESGNYTVKITSNGCSKTSTGVIVSVTPTISQGAITGKTAYCQGEVASALTSTVTGGGSASLTYLWEQSATGNSAWQNAAGTNNAANYTPSTTNAGTVYYRRTVSGGGCTSIGQPIAVAVTPAVQNSISGTQSVCSGSTIAALTGSFSGGDPADVTFRWEQSATGTGNWVAATNAPNNQATYTPETRTVTQNTTTYYRRVVTSGNCTSTSNTVTVTVTAPPVASIVEGANAYFCPPGTATISAQAGAGYSYIWYKVVPGGADQISGLTRTFTTGQEGDYYVRVTDSNNCSSVSNPITVRQTVVGNNIISGEQTVCFGATPAQINGSAATPGNEGETVSYQWQVSSNGTSFTNITTNGTSEDLVLGAHTADRWYQRIAKVGSCSTTSPAVKITVGPELLLSSSLTPSGVCSGANFEYTATSANSGVSFSWVRQPLASGVTASGSGSGSTAAISEVLTNTTANPQDVTYRYTLTANGCTNTQDVVVRVNPRPALSSTLSPAAICSGSTFSYTATSATTGTNFSWVRQPATGITTTAAASGNTAGINHTLTNTTTSPVDVTYTFTLTANGCTNTQDVVVKVNPTPVLSSTISPAAICSGAAFTYSPLSATAGATYSWTRAAVSGISNAAVTTPVSGGVNETLTNSTASSIDVTYTFTLTANGCSNTQNVVVTVNPGPRLSSTLAPPAICSGSTFSYTPTSATSDASFSWSRAVVAGISNAAASGTGSISEILVNTTSSAINVTYQITTSTPECTGITQDVTVRVNPTPTASFTGITSGQTIYSAQNSVNLTPTGTAGGTFSIIAPAGTTGLSGNTLNICSALGTADEKDVTIRYTVTIGTAPNACTAYEDKTVKLKRTTYTAVNVASPFPICKGQNTEYRAIVYRDVIVVPVTDSRHPLYNEWLTEPNADRKSDPKRYWQPFVGVEPLDANGKLQAPSPDQIMNPDDVDKNTTNLFDYQWYKNGNSLGNDRVTSKQAGLSATDEYWVLVTPKSGLGCSGSLETIRSNSLWISTPANYSFALSATNPICAGDAVKLTAIPNVNFDFTNVNLQLYFYIKKAGTPAEEPPVPLNTIPISQPDPGSSPATYSYNIAPGIVENGDVISIFFQTDVVKCLTSGDQGSFVTMIVNERPAIATQPINQTVCANSTAILTVGATGTALTYQWYKRASNSPTSAGSPVANGGRVSGATTASLSIANAQASDAGLYYVIVGGACTPTAQSFNAQLVVNPVTVMTSTPTGNTICPGVNHTFTASATGTNVSYQWYRGSGTNLALINGATNNSYTVSNAGTGDSGDYTVVVTGECGEVRSSATLNVNAATAITDAPQPLIVCEGQPASFAVTATGTNLSYAWRKNGALIGATGNSYQINSASLTDAGNYSVTVTGACGTITTEVVALTVNKQTAISAQPQAAVLCAGQNATFSVTADGTALGYQWLKDGAEIPGATGASYAVNSADSDDDAVYSVRITGACGEITSNAARLTVKTPPVITGPPANRTICVGENTTFSVSATGSDLTYQWYKNGAKLDGATGASFSVANAKPEDGGNYTVQIVGTCNPPITSEVAQLVVNPIISHFGEMKVTWVDNNTRWMVEALTTNSGINPVYKWYVRPFDAQGDDWGAPVVNTNPDQSVLYTSPNVQVKVEVERTEAGCVAPLLLAFTNQGITPLPVEIIYLTAQKQGYDVVLEWATAMEEGNAGFEIQVSQDGLDYRKLDYVATRNGNSSQKQVYKYTDKENGKHGTRYYRLKQTDLSGQFEFFGPKAVEFGSVSNRITVYPNPFVNRLELNVEAEQDGPMEIILSNSVGKQLVQKTVMIGKGVNTEQLILEPGLPQGVYFVTTRMGSVTSHFKVLKR